MRYHKEITMTNIGNKLGGNIQTVPEHFAKTISKLQDKVRPQVLLGLLLFWKWDSRIVKDFVVSNTLTGIVTVLLIIGSVGHGRTGVHNLIPTSPETNCLFYIEDKEIKKDDMANVPALLKLLEADDFEVRDDAQEQLNDMGAKCLPDISKAYSDSSFEVKRIIRAILKKLYESEKTRDATDKTIAQMVTSKILSEEHSEEILSVYHIRTVEKFLDTLGSDRTLIIYKGTFTDEKCLQETCKLNAIRNLKIVGDGKEPVKFLFSYDVGAREVLVFNKCKDISLVNLDITKTVEIKVEEKEEVKEEPKEKSKEETKKIEEKVVRKKFPKINKAIKITECENVAIENSVISDFQLLFTENKKLVVKNSAIKKYQIMGFLNCEGLEFEKVKMYENILNMTCLMYILRTEIKFSDCEIDNLKYFFNGRKDLVPTIFDVVVLPNGKTESSVSFEGGSIKYNPFITICKSIDHVSFKDVEFSSYFAKYSGNVEKVPQSRKDMNSRVIENMKSQSDNNGSSDSIKTTDEGDK